MSSRVRSLLVALLAILVIVVTVQAVRSSTAPDADTAAPSPSAAASRLRSTDTRSASPAPAGRLVVATRGRPKPVVAFAGDAYVTGEGATQPGRTGYVAMLAARLGWTTKTAGLRGAGYLDGPPGGTVLDAIGQPDVLDAIRQLDLRSLDPDLVVLQAGRADATFSDGELQSRVVEAVEAVRRQAPRAQIDVVGVLWPTRPPSGAASVDRVIKAGAEQAGAFFTYTLDRRFSATGPGDLPDDAGHRVIAERLVSSFHDLALLGR